MKRSCSAAVPAGFAGESRRDAGATHFLLFIILFLSYYCVPYSFAADYLFSVPTVEMDVTVLTTGGAAIDYKMDFQNTGNGHPIDVVDIGLPTAKYNIQEMEASANGTALSDIRPSQYVHPGVEVHLDNQTIPPEGSGTFRFHAVVPDLVFQDTTRKDYASFQITPTWFGEQYVTGTTSVVVHVHLPAGIQPEEVLDQGLAFNGKDVENGQVVVSWQVERRFTSEYRVGVSFPKRVMSHVVTMSIPEMLVRWYKSAVSPATRVALGFFSLVVLAIIFFRFTGGTGGCLFIPVAIALIVTYVASDLTQILIWPVLLVVGFVVENARRHRKAKYLPAIASVEGGGIKRGLTAPEAALLLEMPVNKVVTLVLFGMMKKGLIRQTSTDPLTFSAVPNPPPEVIQQPYEKDTLTLLNAPIHKIDFGNVMENLITAAAQKMKGFDLDQTREYYKQIISRAWLEAKSIGDVETWQKTMDDKIDWMILDPNFEDRFRPYSTRYIPRSYRTYPSFGGTTAGGSGGGAAGGSAPRFSDVAGSVSGWLQNTAQGVVAKIEGQSGGIVNLGGFDKAMAKAMQSSGSGGHGSGGGCACACAGCACACACAGGGR